MTSIGSASVQIAAIASPAFVAAAWTWWQLVLDSRSLQIIEGSVGMFAKT